MFRWHILEHVLWGVLLVIWPGQGFYVELFLFMHFPLWRNHDRKGIYSDVSSAKDIKLAALLHNFRGHKNIHQLIQFQIHQFYLNYVGKGRAFNCLLSYIRGCTLVGSYILPQIKLKNSKVCNFYFILFYSVNRDTTLWAPLSWSAAMGSGTQSTFLVGEGVGVQWHRAAQRVPQTTS